MGLFTARQVYVLQKYTIQWSKMEEIITARFKNELVKKVDEAVERGHFQSRSDALRVITEEYLREHPQLFLGDQTKRLINEAPDLSDEELEDIGRKLFKNGVAKLVAEGRSRT